MKKKINPLVSAYYSKLGKKSAEARLKKIMESSKPLKAENKITK